MKSLLFSLLFFTILFTGCTDDSSDLISSVAKVTKQLTSPNWIKLPGDKGQDFSVDSKYSGALTFENITGCYT